MAVHQIFVGSESSPTFSFNDDSISLDSILIDISIDVVGEELTTDQFEVEVIYNDVNGTLKALAWSTPIYYYFNDILAGKFYSTKVVRTGTNKYKIYATSAYGILDYKPYYGGIWSGEKFSDVVRNIIATDGIAKYEKGYYTKLHRGNYGVTTGNFIGLRVYNVGTPSTSDWYSNWYSQVDYTCKLEAKFTLNKCLLNELGEGFSALTSKRLYLLGVSSDGNVASSQYYQYGMYMDVSRASVNDPWPDFGEVFFAYSTSVYSLGTPTEATTYTISVDPGNSVATINGVDYAISFDISGTNRYAPIGVYAGGSYIALISGSSIYSYTGDLYCDALYEYYRIYSASNSKIADFATMKKAFSSDYTVIDLVTTIYANFSLRYIEVNSSDYVGTIDSETYPVMAGYPVVDLDDFQQSLLDGIEYENSIDNLSVYGWIDICSKREALHQLLFAFGVILKKSATGNILFTYPTDSIAGTISQDSIFVGGEEEYLEHTNEIEVTEHSYYYDSTQSAVTVFDNINAPTSKAYYAEYKNRPIASVTLRTVLSLESNCNAAVLWGGGGITGKPYIVDSAVVKRSIADYEDGKTVSVTDATLVTAQNSAIVADRLEAYYGSANKVKNSFVNNGETCGLKYSFTNPFGEAKSGFLARISQRPSSFLKANAEFVCNYEPPSYGVDYTNYVILTGNGTWEVPQEVFEKDVPRIRVVLIGGGTGGSSGYAGHDGSNSVISMSMTPAQGGEGGESGSGGNVYEIVIDNPSASYSYSCGVGGSGGDISTSAEISNSGSIGTDTSFSDGVNSLSSASGIRLANGYVNLFNGDIYAKPLKYVNWNKPIDSFSNWYYGRGGFSSYRTVRKEGGSTYLYAIYAPGHCYGVFDQSGKSWSGAGMGNTYETPGYWWTTGGGGGGGAAGGTATKGTDGTRYKGGNGGNGANAELVPAKATTYKSNYYGYGGQGGYGGGGGGCGGILSNASDETAGVGGKGGYGGKGGDGGDGCVLIYY